jgi:hypothetical protein
MDDTVRIFNSQTTGLYVASHSALRATGEGSKLVFHRYGASAFFLSFFLSGVWVTGKRSGRELFPSRAERELTDRKIEMELAVVHPEKLHSAK